MANRIVRLLVAGVAGGLAWQAGMMIIFGLAQSTLADPKWQSAKFNAVFQTIEPLPRTVGQPLLLIGGLIGISILYATVHDTIRVALSGSIWFRSTKFGLILWAVMVPWFEFYLPWNVMHEPPMLVLLECLCWFVVLQLVALAIVATDQWIRSDAN
jgi:hypothetical protein